MKYDIEFEVSIKIQLEPTGYIDEPVGSEIDDCSIEGFNGAYGNECEETTRGTCVLDLDCSEDDAETEAESWLTDNLSYTGDDNEWEISDVSILSCEKQEMSLDTAKGILLGFCRTYKGDGANDELIAAITVILDQIG